MFRDVTGCSGCSGVPGCSGVLGVPGFSTCRIGTAAKAL